MVTFEKRIELMKEFRKTFDVHLSVAKKYLDRNDWDIEKAKEQFRKDTRESMKRFGGILDG